MNTVEVSQLRVDYDEVTAVSDISFHLERGKIYSLIIIIKPFLKMQGGKRMHR